MHMMRRKDSDEASKPGSNEHSQDVHGSLINSLSYSAHMLRTDKETLEATYTLVENRGSLIQHHRYLRNSLRMPFHGCI